MRGLSMKLRTYSGYVFSLLVCSSYLFAQDMYISSQYLDAFQASSLVQFAMISNKLEYSVFFVTPILLYENVDDLYFEMLSGYSLKELHPIYIRSNQHRFLLFFNRAGIHVSKGALEIFGGRIRFPTGKMRIAQLIDDWNPRTTISFLPSGIQGTDGVRIQYYLDGFSFLEFRYARFQGKNIWGAGYSTLIGPVDAELWVKYRDTLMLEGGFEGSLSRFGIRAEFRFTGKGKRMFSFGGDIDLGKESLLLIEWVSSTEVFPSSMWFIDLSSKIHPLIKVHLVGAYIPRFTSTLLGGFVELNMSDSTDIELTIFWTKNPVFFPKHINGLAISSSF